MAATKRKPAQIAANRKEIMHLYLSEGLIQVEIAERLGMSQQMVSYDIRAVNAVWQREAVADVTVARGAEMARLANLEAEYWDAWRNHLDKEHCVRPAYLDGVLRCIERRCKLLGIDAPQRVDLTSLGKPIEFVEVRAPEGADEDASE